MLKNLPSSKKTWRLLAKVNLEKLDKNLFKFSFSNGRYHNFIYQGRPWSLKGILIVFKEWPINKVVKDKSLTRQRSMFEFMEYL